MTGPYRRGRAAGVLLACLASCAAWAQDRILDHSIELHVLGDGRLDVTERIEVRTEGGVFRHGIVHTLPNQTRDHPARARIAEVEILDVLRDGQPEAWTRRRTADGTRLHIGDARHLPMPSQPVYTLRYRLDRQLDVGTDNARLTMDTIRADQGVPVERGHVTVHLPRAVPVDALQTTGSTGAAGMETRDFRIARSASGIARWSLVRPLQAGEHLTVSLAFPADVVTPPGRAQQWRWWLGDRAGVLVALAGVVALSALCLLRRRQRRHVAPATAAGARVVPPAGISPAGLRYVSGLRYDDRCTAADLVASAVQDHLHFQRDRADGRTGWRLVRIHEGASTLPTMEQRALLRALLPEPQASLTLDAAHAAHIRHARQAHAAALRQRFQPAMFRVSGAHMLVALTIASAFAIPALVLAARTGMTIPTLAMLAPMLPLLVVLGVLAKTLTPDGRRLQTEIDALRASLADGRSAFASSGNDPASAAARYVALLPHAVALEVEAAWTRAFIAAVGREAAAAAMAALPWYAGITVTDPERFGRSLGRRLTARIGEATSRRRRPGHAGSDAAPGAG